MSEDVTTEEPSAELESASEKLARAWFSEDGVVTEAEDFDRTWPFPEPAALMLTVHQDEQVDFFVVAGNSAKLGSKSPWSATISSGGALVITHQATPDSEATAVRLYGGGAWLTVTGQSGVRERPST